MNRVRAAAFAAASLSLLVLIAAGWWWLSRPGPLHLSRSTFADLPGWQEAKLEPALLSFQRGCAILQTRSAGMSMGGAGYAGKVGDWLGPCDAAARQAMAARRFFESGFTPYTVRAGWVRGGVFTGYYEPQIRASRFRHGAFQTPVYGLPPDLVRVDLGQFSPRLNGEHIAGRLDGQRLVPYPDRAAIDASGIAKAPSLLYTDDPVGLFFLQIQGSGRVRFDDGAVARLGYAGDNGQPYTAIGRVLIAAGALTKENVSLQSIRAWLKAHSGRARAVMEADKSYVFFYEAPLGDTALGSRGTLGAALTPGASLAVDPRLHALGAPFYVVTDGDVTLESLLIAQDTGGAIRGPVRGDVFFGFGTEAESRAGGMKAEGKMFVLLPNGLAARLGAEWP